jgi:DNA-binding winged helix-turn-helix (wHTH) protein
MKTKHLLVILSILSLIVFGMLVNDIQNDDHYNLAKREILMRKIGHEILLHSGDSISRVLPVTKLPGKKYQLQFEKKFTFEPDTLVRIIRRTLTLNNETPDYIVNVLDCSNHSVIYGYAIAQLKKNDVIACSGRAQVSGCYLVTVEFGNEPYTIKKYGAAASLLAFVLLCPLIVLNYRKKQPSPAKIVAHKNNAIAIGTILFDRDKKQLITTGETLNLTAKETRLLFIFAQDPNVIIDRARLQKEIWEDDGIIVGRSLDVFISKLRKKLESDANVQLVNIHGKGYKLQIGPTEN